MQEMSEPKAKVARIEAPELEKAPMAVMQDPAKNPVEWTSEAQEHADNLMAWMERNAGASEGPSGADEQVAEDEAEHDESGSF